MVLKYSRQRESIKNYLADSKDHPTADTIYNDIRKEYPNISLGTVYRNLNLLVKQGYASKIITENASDRYDGNTKPHYHFSCTECSKVSDIFLSDDFIDTVNQSASSKFNDGEIHGHNLIFNGICNECQNNSKQDVTED